MDGDWAEVREARRGWNMYFMYCVWYLEHGVYILVLHDLCLDVDSVIQWIDLLDKLIYSSEIVRGYRRNSESGPNLSIYKYISIKLVQLER
jgi:hypothetical protein